MNEFDRTLLKSAVLAEFKKSEVKVQNTESTKKWVEEIYGRHYRVRRFGDQIWMIENLKISPSQLPFCPGINTMQNAETGECYYTWEDAMEIAKRCLGWHLPSDEEFDRLSKLLGIWIDSGFDVKISGFVYNGQFNDLDLCTGFWTSTEYGSGDAYRRLLDTGTSLYSSSNSKTLGYPIRLVKDF